jgi:hypothetical protein
MALHGKGVEHALATAEVPPERGVADAQIAGDGAQAERVHAAAGDHAGRRPEDRRTQIAVGITRHGPELPLDT